MRLRILLCVLLLCLLAAPVASAAKSYSADRFDVDVEIVEDGSLLVTETVTFRFAGGPFTTVFRDLVADETDGIDQVVASMDGRPMPLGSGQGQVEISNLPAAHIEWHFAPTSDSVHTFTLSYRMLGVIRQEKDADVLSFRLLPAEHEYEIGSSALRVTYPSSARLTGEPRVLAGSVVIVQEPGEVIFESDNIKPDRTVQVRLDFEKGSLISAAPQWQELRSAQAGRIPVWLGGALAILLAGGAALASFWRKNVRSAPVAAVGALSVMRPPSELPPALAGMLKDNGAGPQWHQGMATLLDLARRGALVIEELPKSRWGQHDFTVTLREMPASLRPHEEKLLALLYSKKQGKVETSPAVGDVVKMSELQSRYGKQWSAYAKALQDEAHGAGFFDAGRERVRRNFLVAGTLLLIADIVAFIVAAILTEQLGPWPMLLPAALFALSIAAYVMGLYYSPLSDEAAQQRPRWDGFASYLGAVAKGTQPFVGSRLLDEYLPFAASFGQAAAWAKLYKMREGEDVLGWFRPLASADDGVESLVTMISASSAVGSSGGAGGGGGAAGGGASGAH